MRPTWREPPLTAVVSSTLTFLRWISINQSIKSINPHERTVKGRDRTGMNARTRETVTPDVVVVPARVALYRRPDRPRRNGKCTFFAPFRESKKSIQLFSFYHLVGTYVQTGYQAHERDWGSLLRVLNRQRYQICFPRLTSSERRRRVALLWRWRHTLARYVRVFRSRRGFFLLSSSSRGLTGTGYVFAFVRVRRPTRASFRHRVRGAARLGDWIRFIHSFGRSGWRFEGSDVRTTTTRGVRRRVMNA
jgi:hypothetical protein